MVNCVSTSAVPPKILADPQHRLTASADTPSPYSLAMADAFPQYHAAEQSFDETAATWGDVCPAFDTKPHPEAAAV